MNWERAKTILTFMFLAVDVFLLIVLLQSEFSATRLADSVVEETVSVLRAHQITVDAEKIPLKRAKNQNVVMRNYFEEPERIAKNMLGSFAAVQSDSATHTYEYRHEEKSLSIHGTRFLYRYAKQDSALYDKDADRQYNAAQMAKSVSERLEKLGFDKNTLRVCEGTFCDGLYTCRVMPLYQQTAIYGVAMQVTMDREDVVQLEGTWFKPISAEADEEERLIDVTSVLSGLVFENTNRDIILHRIENAYFVDESYLDNREVAAMPVYVIEGERQTAGRQVLCWIFNAKNGAVILEPSKPQTEAEAVLPEAAAEQTETAEVTEMQ